VTSFLRASIGRILYDPSYGPLPWQFWTEFGGPYEGSSSSSVFLFFNWFCCLSSFFVGCLFVARSFWFGVSCIVRCWFFFLWKWGTDGQKNQMATRSLLGLCWWTTWWASVTLEHLMDSVGPMVSNLLLSTWSWRFYYIFKSSNESDSNCMFMHWHCKKYYCKAICESTESTQSQPCIESMFPPPPPQKAIVACQETTICFKGFNLWTLWDQVPVIGMSTFELL
jgi:hypothetical protein